MLLAPLALAAPAHAVGAANDAIGSATTVTVSSTPTVTPISNVGATRDPNEAYFYGGTLGDGSDADSASCYANSTVWYKIAAPSPGRLAVTLSGLSAGFDAQFVVFKATSSTPTYANVANVSAAVPAANLRVGNTTDNTTQTIETDLVGTGGPYLVGIAGCDAENVGDGGAGVTGTGTLTTTFTARPANDLFASAAALGASQTADVRGAATAKENNEPSSYSSGSASDCNGASSVWYSIAPGAGHLRVQSADETFDGTVSLASESSSAPTLAALDVAEITRVGTVNGHADLNIDTVVGKKYWVRVEHCNPDPYRSIIPLADLGTLTLTSTFSAAPGNDGFSTPTVLTGTSGSVGGDTTGASTQTDEIAGPVDGAGYDVGKSLWYQWTVPTSGTYVIDTKGAAFNTNLAIGVRASSIAGQEYGTGTSDDISGVNLASRVQFTAASGQVLAIRVSGVDDGTHAAAGTFTLHWGFAPDTIIPTLKIVSPTNNSRFPRSRTLRVAVKAADNKNQIKHVVIGLTGYDDQTVVTSSGKGIYNADFNISGLPGDTRLTVTAQVEDQSGNTSLVAHSKVTVDDGHLPAGYVGSTRGSIAAGRCIGITGTGGAAKVTAKGGPFWRTTKKKQTLVVKFVGSRIDLSFLADKKSGTAKITLDGVSTTVNLGSKKSKTLLKAFSEMLPVQHKLVITNLGVKGTSSTGVKVQLNRVRVYNPK